MRFSNNTGIEEIVKAIVNAAYDIHTRLGPGLFESVYEEILSVELEKLGLHVVRQKILPLTWEGRTLEKAFKADLVVNDKVIIEVKAVESLAPVHFKQLLTYLRVTDMRIGLLINFDQATLKGNIRRVVNNYEPEL
ncbi:MAG TPA: GxxExxY protein [Phaeodactylibacter sp.]|nr:GxxExxY protein [Phaeodactylibacter sp.]